MRNGDSEFTTLTADTVATVTLDADFQTVEIVCLDALGAVFFTTDGTDPAVDLQGCYVVQPGGSLTVPSAEAGATAVKLISLAAVHLAVIGRNIA